MKVSNIRKGAIIAHFKRYYEVDETPRGLLDYLYKYEGTAINTENGTMNVIYTSLYDSKDGHVHIGDTFVRPLEMFESDVDLNKYPNSAQRERFVELSLQYGLNDREYKAYTVARGVVRALEELCYN